MDVNINSVTGIPHVDTPLDFGLNNTVLIVLIVVIIGFYLLFASLGGSSSSRTSSSVGGVGTSSKSKSSLEILIWGVFIVLILMNGMMYFFNVDITTSVKNLFSNTPEIDVLVNNKTEIGEDNDSGADSGDNGSGPGGGDGPGGGGGDSGGSNEEPVPEIMAGKQVFHIPGNKYVYEDAGAICDAYGARLANYKEIEDAYKKGADWCSYGWSADQMALFPTQYDKWQNLQKIQDHENDCGRPGINGGFIANPNVRFGINCYGHKPKITQEEEELMDNSSEYPKTNSEIEFDNRVDAWREKLPDILVAPFNHNNWSVI